MIDLFKKYRWLIQIFISVVLVFFIYKKNDFRLLLFSISNLSWYILFIIFFIGLLQIFIVSIIQQNLFRIYSSELKLKTTFRENFIASFYGLVLPGMIGNDLYMVNYFGRQINSYFNSFAGIALLRVIGLLIFFSSIVVSLFYINENTIQIIRGLDLIIKKPVIYIGMLMTIVGVTLIIIFRKRIEKLLIKIKFKAIDLLVVFRLNKKSNFKIVLLIFLYYVIAMGGRTLLAKDTGIDIPFPELIAMILIVNFLIMLPVSYSGVGIREAGYIGFLMMFDIDKNKAVLFSIMDFSITIFVFSVGAVITLVNAVQKSELITLKK